MSGGALYGTCGNMDSSPMEVVVLLPSPSINERNSLPRSASPLKSCSSSGSVCRICHEGDRHENLISPCDCTGTVALVHISCIEKWLSTSNTDRCEICKFKFTTERDSRPVTQWLLSERGPAGPNGFYGDLLCLLLLTPLCFISVYLCSIGALAYIERGLWEGVGLAILNIFVLFTYLLWGFITIRFHLRCFRRWRSSCQVIHLAPDAVQPRTLPSGTPLEP